MKFIPDQALLVKNAKEYLAMLLKDKEARETKRHANDSRIPSETCAHLFAIGEIRKKEISRIENCLADIKQAQENLSGLDKLGRELYDEIRIACNMDLYAPTTPIPTPWPAPPVLSAPDSPPPWNL